jgi:hypothetical protein
MSVGSSSVGRSTVRRRSRLAFCRMNLLLEAPPVDAQSLHRLSEICAHRSARVVRRLAGDGLQIGTNQVRAGRAARDARDRAHAHPHPPRGAPVRGWLARTQHLRGLDPLGGRAAPEPFTPAFPSADFASPAPRESTSRALRLHDLGQHASLGGRVARAARGCGARALRCPTSMQMRE